MMTTFIRKLLSGLLALTLLLSLVPAALAEETGLQLALTGLYARKDGSYEAVAASGSFEVYQDGQLVETVSVTPEEEDPIVLPGSGDVVLRPVAGSYPAELPLSEYGYAVTISAGRLNVANLQVYANAGLFRICSDYQADFELLDSQGQEALSFRTDEEGMYDLEQAIPAGSYTLRMTGSPALIWDDQTIEIVPYSGKESILKVTAPRQAAADPEPTAQPTPESMQAPAEATARETEAAPAVGTLVLTAEGNGSDVTYTVSDLDAAVVAQGSFSAAAPAVIPQLAEGEYQVVLTLADDTVMTALNGNAAIQRGQAQWHALVAAQQESNYLIGLSAAGSMIMPVENIDNARVQAVSEVETCEMILNAAAGSYEAASLLPGTYTVTALLPQGRYADASNSWTLTANEDGTVTASVTMAVNAYETAQLPLLSRSVIGSAAGVVYDTKGNEMKGVKVAIYGENGSVIANAETDAKGVWHVPHLVYGEYVAQYSDDKFAIPASSFTLSDSNTDAQLTASAAKPVKVTVRAFMDKNNNGAAGKKEDGVRDVTVSLIDASGLVADTGVTDRNGYVTLYAAEGTYTVRATVAEDHGFGKRGNGTRRFTESLTEETGERTQETTPMTLKTGDSVEIGIGVVETCIVRGTIWNDLNADGIWQEEEPGIPNVRMTMTGGRERISVDVYTDENGVYEFHQITQGTYNLICHVPDEYVFTVKAKGNEKIISRMTTEKEREGSDRISLEAGEVYQDHNIGMMEGAIIEGICFEDANYNGIYDEGEQPLPGVELRLARQSNNVLLQTAVSDENGVYHFVGQRGSTFSIRATLPKNYVFSALGTGEDANQFAPNGNKDERRLTDVTLENGEYRKIMLGAVSFGSISGQVYYDDNFSAMREKGEPAGKNFYVSLHNESGDRVARVTSDRNGHFEFNSLVPGNYTIRMSPSKGYAFTALGDGNVMKTLPDGTGESRVIPLGMGQKVTQADIGMIIPAIVSGMVYADENDNGLHEAGEEGLKGTVVRLMNEAGEVSAITIGADGAFRFSTTPGSFYLQYELPEHGVFAPVAENGNAISGENGVGRSEWFRMEQGGKWDAPLCGAVLLSDISGFAFTDSNGNARMDEDETFFAGMTITLTPSRSDLSEISVVTGADGAFAMNDLRPDVYTLTVAWPGAFVLSRMENVYLGLVNGAASQSIPLDLKMGTQWHDQYLGCVLPSRWTGEAYLDENYDGVHDAGEAPAVGETFILRDANTGEDVMSVKTDENGVFCIEGIAPGEYELVYLLDEGNLTPKDPYIDFQTVGNVMTNGRVQIRENTELSGTKLSIARTTEIGGLVWLEKYDGVTPVEGVKVHLLNSYGEVVAEYTTGEDGRYVFKGLMPGDYAIDATIPEGYVLVENNDPRLEEAGLISEMEAVEGLFGRSEYIQLQMARHRLDMNVGMVLPGRLGDKVWLDLNGNGLQDGEEGGIPGVTIELIREDQVIASTVSDQYGYYVFEDLYPTEYTLQVTWPAEVRPTQLRPEIHQISSVLQENGLSIPVTVESDKENYAADLGFILVEEGKFPAGYGEGETQNWKKKR